MKEEKEKLKKNNKLKINIKIIIILKKERASKPINKSSSDNMC